MLGTPKSALQPLAPGTVWVNMPGPENNWQAMNVMDFDGIPGEDYARYFGSGKRIAFAQDHQRWHSKFWAPATTIAASAQGYDFFGKKSGDADTSLDTGATAVVTDDYITNMAIAGQMEKGSFFIVHALAIQCTIPHREFGAFTGTVRPNTAAVTATDTSSATGHSLLIDNNSIFSFYRGSGVGAQNLVQGSLYDFPSKGGPGGGVMGGATPEGAVTNGFGYLEPLREVIVLSDGDQFKLTMRTYIAMLSVLRVELRAKLYGTLVRTL